MSLEPKDIPFLGELTDNVCLSGGAAGADVTWGHNAHDAGHQVVHWSFKGHKSHDPDRTYILTEEELTEADEYLKEANVTLKRRLNFHNDYVINLLRRNWYQVKYAESVYVVGSLNDKAIIYDPQEGHDQKYHLTNDRKDRMGINGGTAWACQLYLDLYRRNLGEMNFFLLLYDQIKQDVFAYSPQRGCWMPIPSVIITGSTMLIEKPKGIYAAIGSRALEENGKIFIEKLYQ